MLFEKRFGDALLFRGRGLGDTVRALGDGLSVSNAIATSNVKNNAHREEAAELSDRIMNSRREESEMLKTQSEEMKKQTGFLNKMKGLIQNNSKEIKLTSVFMIWSLSLQHKLQSEESCTQIDLMLFTVTS